VLIAFAAQHLAVLLLCLAAANGAGRLVFGRRESAALTTALGIAIWAHACFFLGIAGFLRGEVLLVLALTALAARATRKELVFVLALLPLALLALYPPHAFDETLYHLPFVRAFAAHGGMAVLPTLRFPVFPVLHELLAVPPFLLLGDTGTHLVALVEFVAIVLLLATWAAEYHPRAGWLAAAMFIGSPLVIELATVLYVEMALTLFVVAGFYALDHRRYVLAGLFLGTACSVKYLGAHFAVAALPILATRFRATAVYALACAAAALPMTIWIFVHTRDVVFPFGGHTVWAHPHQPPDFTRLPRLLWDVTFARDRVGLQPPVTPFLIALVLLVLAGALRDTRTRILIMLSAVYVGVFVFLPPDSRYLMPLLPLFSVAAAVELARRWPRIITFAAILAIAPGLAYAGYRVVKQGTPPATNAGQRAWLERRVPEYRALRRAGAEPVYVCGGERLKAYAEGELLGDFTGPWSYQRVLAGADGTTAIAARMRRIDARYFLVAKHHCPSPRADGGMDLTYEDQSAQLWRVR
jgi:hypothetical protein